MTAISWPCNLFVSSAREALVSVTLALFMKFKSALEVADVGTVRNEDVLLPVILLLAGSSTKLAGSEFDPTEILLVDEPAEYWNIPLDPLL